MSVYIRFERGRDDVIGPTYGPYDFIQVTYGLVRASRNGEETELATADKQDDGDWVLVDSERNETVFSDFIIYDAPQPALRGVRVQEYLAGRAKDNRRK